MKLSLDRMNLLKECIVNKYCRNRFPTSQNFGEYYWLKMDLAEVEMVNSLVATGDAKAHAEISLG